MPYTKTPDWQDGPGGGTPLTAANLDGMQDALAAYTDTRYTASVNYTNSKTAVVNVKADHGAVGNGATDDRVAIQAAIDAAYAAPYGGKVFFPAGAYFVSSPGLSWPQSATKSISLVGEGSGGVSTSDQPTRIYRNGAYPLVTFTHSGTSNRGVQWADLCMDGAAFASPLIDAHFLSNGSFVNVRFKNSTRELVKGRCLWNFHFNNCWFTDGGDLTTPTAALALLGSTTVTTDATNTVLITNCEFEGNGGTDILLNGSTSPNLPCVGVEITNCKLERSLGHAVHFKHACQNSISNSYIQRANTSPPTIYYEEGSNVTASANSVIGNNMAISGSPNGFHIDMQTGRGAVVMGNTLYGSNGTAGIRMQSGFGNAHVIGNIHPSWVSPQTVVQDLRTSKVGQMLN